jgi:hypothetical protein
MPSQGAFEVLKANGYIHATSEWIPEDQVPPRFTGKFPLPDPGTHHSNPKLFIFTDQLASRPERTATHQAPDDHDSFTSSPSGPRGEYRISIRGQSRLNSVPSGYSGEFNHGPDGHSAQDGNYFGGHNTGPVITAAASAMMQVATTLALVVTGAASTLGRGRVDTFLALVVVTGAALTLVRVATVPRAATLVTTLVATILSPVFTAATTEVATGKVLAMV